MLANTTTFLATLALAATTPQAPEWESDYGKALKQTRSDDRPLLIVLDKPAAEQGRLDADVLNGADKKLLNSYDLCRVNVETEYGQQVAKAFEAKKFPYVAIIDKTGSVILHSQAGDITKQAWKSTLAKYQSGERAVRVTVAKPIVSDEGVLIESSPIYSTPVSGTPAYYNPPTDCPNCRRGY